MTKIIAEIGWNHMGDMELAKEMITAANDSGADIVKTQTFDVRRLKEGPWDTDGRREIYEKAQLNLEQYIELRDYCNKIEIQFMSSVFSIDDAKLLQKVETDMVKIPSMESRNVKLINYLRRDDSFICVFVVSIQRKCNITKPHPVIIHNICIPT